MADTSFQAGLTDQDELSQFPSAANPLTSLGIDPDMARANPDLLASLNAQVPGATVRPSAPIPGPMTMPTGDDEQAAAPAPSVTAAGRAGGAGDTPSSTSTGTTATPAPPTTPTEYGMAGLGMLDQNAQMATKAAGDIPTTNPDVDRLTAQRDKLATPPSLYDPKTGKMLSQTQEYDPATGQPISINPKPSVGQRIWRGVRGGLVGLAAGGIPGAIVGSLEPQDIPGGTAYGAPNSAFQKAETRRGQELGATDTDLDTSFKNWKDQVDAAKAKASEFRANAGIGKDETTGATGMENATTDAQREKDTAANNSPAAKLQLNQDEFNQRQQRVATMPHLSPLQKTLYMLNGKIPDPQQPNEAEVNAAQAARALTVFKMSHGGQGPKTLEDFNQIQSAARGMMDRGKSGDPNADDEVSSIVADATGKKQEFADQYERNADGSYSKKGTYEDPKTTISAQEFQDKIDQFRSDANTKLAKKGAQIDAQGKLVRSGAPASAATPAGGAPKAVKVSSGATVTVGQAVTDGKRTGTVTGVNPQTNKPIVAWNP